MAGPPYHLARRVELDHPVVACVGDVEIAGWVDGDACGIQKFDPGDFGSPELVEKLALGVEFLNAMVSPVHHV